MKKLIGLLFVGIFSSSVIAQDISDVGIYSVQKFNGSARVAALGNAFGAVGADIGGININPANIALFRSDYYSITPGIQIINSNSDYLGNNTSSTKLNFFIGNMGIVKSRKTATDNTNSVLKSYNYGFTINKVNNFQNKITGSGFNADNSLIQHFVQEANSNYPFNTTENIKANFPFSSYNAFLAGLITNLNSSNGDFTGMVSNGGVKQGYIINEKGGVTEYGFSAGGNIKDKLFFGINANLSYLRYVSRIDFKEQDQFDTIKDLKSYTYSQNLNLTGAGLNTRLGIIYVPSEKIRLGISLRSPGIFVIGERYSTNIDATFDNGTSKSSPSESSIAGGYNYKLPSSLTLSGAYFHKNGLISADLEHSNLKTAKYSSPSDPFYGENINAQIKNIYGSSMSARIGTEYRVKFTYFRGGLAYYSSPYSNSFKNTIGNNNKGQQVNLTCGVGFKKGNDFFDIALVNNITKSNYIPYTIEGANSLLGANRVSKSIIMFTIGSRI